jgi:hypothetical protein
VNKVVQNKPVMPVCVNLFGAFLKVRAPADEWKARSPSRGGLREQWEQDSGKPLGACDMRW